MAPKRIRLAQLKNYWKIYFLLVPSLLIVLVFRYVPFASGVYHAFFRWNGDYIREYIGLDNFVQAVTDPVLHWGFAVIAILVLANLFRMMPSIMTAVAISRLKNARISYVYRVIFVVPMIVPEMVILLIWKFFFDPSAGILNKLLEATGGMRVLERIDNFFGWGIFFEGSSPAWLGDWRLVIPSLILWDFPWVGVTGVLIYLAGLQSIDESIYEAAEIDGIGPFSRFFYIELPLILTQVRINLILMIIATLRGFGQLLVLFGTGGGERGIAMVPGLYMYANAFEYGHAGYACAIGIILFFFIVLLTWVNNRFVRIEK